MKIDKKKIIVWISLIVLVLVAFFLRFKAFPKDGMWFDELYSVWVASGDFPMGILKRLYEDDAHAPLYHYILHFFIQRFGASDFALMMFNTIVSLFTIPIAYLLGSEVAGGKKNENAYKFGLFSALLLTFSYFHIAFSQESRFYNLTGIFLALSTLFFFRLINNGYNKKDLAGIIVFNILMCYTVTQGCIYVFIQALVFGIYFLKNSETKRELIKPLVTASLVTFLLYIPYIPFIYHQFWTSHNSFVGSYGIAESSFTYIMEIFYNWFAHTPMIYTQIKDIADLSLDYNRFSLALYITEVILFAIFLTRSMFIKDKSKKLLFTFLLSICIFHITFLLLHLAPFMPRYTIAFMPIFAVCFAGVLYSMQNKWARILILSFLIIPGIISPFIMPHRTCFMNLGRFGLTLEALKDYDLTIEDKLYKSHSAKLVPPKGITVTPIDVCHNATFLFYNPRRLEMIFGNDYLKYHTREERENYLEDYIFDPEISIHNRNFYNKEIDGIKKGARLVIWVPTIDTEYDQFVKEYHEFKNQPREIKKTLVKDFTPKKDYYQYLSTKIDEDWQRLAFQDKRLKFVDGEPVYSGAIYMFKKIKD